MNVQISTDKVADGWKACCGTIEVTRKRKADAIAGCRERIQARLSADTRLPRIIAAIDANRVWVATPDPDGGTIVVGIDTLTGHCSGTAYLADDLDSAVDTYKRHAKDLLEAS